MKQINIKFVRIGAKIQAIQLPDNKLSELQKIVSTKKGGSFYRNGKRLNKNSLLKDGDIVIYVFPIRGAVTVRRHGKIWMIHKYDAHGFPSDFHAHNYVDNEVLDLYTGFLYKSHTKVKMAKLYKKDYKAVLIDLSERKDKKFSEKAKRILRDNFNLK